MLVPFRENHKKQKITIIRYFILLFAIFSKTVELSSVFNAEMNSTCQNILITAFLWDLEKKAVFLRIFALTTLWQCEGYGLKNLPIPFWPNLATFHLKKTMIPLLLCNSASNFQRKSQKKQKITIIRYFILFFAFFSKTVELSSVFNAEMNSTCQNTLLTTFLWNFEKKNAVFLLNFCPYYSMAMWRLWAKKLINTILAEFGVFTSKNHDSIVFMQFCQ